MALVDNMLQNTKHDVAQAKYGRELMMVASRIQTLDFTKCNYNDMYRAIHDFSLVSPLLVQHVKSLTQNPKKKRPKTRYPTHITSEHRCQIGTPAGVVTAANPTGISRKQLPSSAYLFVFRVEVRFTFASENHEKKVTRKLFRKFYLCQFSVSSGSDHRFGFSTIF